MVDSDDVLTVPPVPPPPPSPSLLAPSPRLSLPPLPSFSFRSHLRSLFWKKLPPSAIKSGTVWHAISKRHENVNEEELQLLFSVRASSPCRYSQRCSSPLAMSMRLLDAKKSQAIAIHLRNLPEDMTKLQEIVDSKNCSLVHINSLAALAELVQQ